MRRGCLLPVALVGCGHLNLDPQSDGPSPPPDAPLPALVCSASRTPLASVGTGSDLAIATTSGGFVVAWTSAASGSLHAARLDDTRRVIAGPVEVAAGPFDGVAGIYDLGETYGVVTIAGANQTLRSINRELGAPQIQRSEAMVAAREPFAPANSVVRAMLRGDGTRIAMSYVREDGTVFGDGFFDAGQQIVAVSGDEGPGHGHVAWQETDGVMSRCVAADIDYAPPMPPVMGSGYPISNDCYEVRNANGPPPADSMIVAWRTRLREVLAKYIVSTGEKSVTVSTAGRAPRVRFDGTSRFWIAWIDEDRDPHELRVGWIGLDGTIMRSSLAAWTPASDEAFEVVRNGVWTYVAVLGADGALDVLGLCE